jgi:hypothetical protein
MPEPASNGPKVVVHHAGSATEAMVIRGLLQSAGLSPLDALEGDELLQRETTGETEIVVYESEAEDARRIIADYLSSGENFSIEPTEE